MVEWEHGNRTNIIGIIEVNKLKEELGAIKVCIIKMGNRSYQHSNWRALVMIC